MKTFAYKGYQGSSECSVEDECLFGRILFVRDLVTYEGETVAELEVAFREAVDDYLSTCAKLGKAPDKPFRGSFNVRVNPERHREIAVAAAQEGVSLNEWITEAVDERLGRTRARA